MAKKDKSLITLFSKSDTLTFNVSDEFITLLKQVAKNEGVSRNKVFNELIELMTEELCRKLD